MRTCAEVVPLILSGKCDLHACKYSIRHHNQEYWKNTALAIFTCNPQHEYLNKATQWQIFHQKCKIVVFRSTQDQGFRSRTVVQKNNMKLLPVKKHIF
jgi:hypothetical protein